VVVEVVAIVAYFVRNTDGNLEREFARLAKSLKGPTARCRNGRTLAPPRKGP
jgi:hypothetical protein